MEHSSANMSDSLICEENHPVAGHRRSMVGHNRGFIVSCYAFLRAVEYMYGHQIRYGIQLQRMRLRNETVGRQLGRLNRRLSSHRSTVMTMGGKQLVLLQSLELRTIIMRSMPFSSRVCNSEGSSLVSASLGLENLCWLTCFTLP